MSIAVTSKRPALRIWALAAAALGVVACGVMAQDADTPKPEAKKAVAKKTADTGPRPDDEPVALAFVSENHPELADLLDTLKTKKAAEYTKAIHDLAQTSRNLQILKARDPKRFEFQLAGWKARSRVDLLAARLASAPGPDPALESQLRQAVEEQADREILRLRFERDTAEERLKRVTENLAKAEGRRPKGVEARYKALLKNAQKARDKAQADANADKPTPTPDPKPQTPTDPGKTQP